jgi:outer membrane protein assembly complex protein YaeT
LAPRIPLAQTLSALRSHALLALVCALLLSMAASSAKAQRWEDLTGRSIVSIEVEGQARGLVDASDLPLHTGELISRQRLQAAARTLLASGDWADVAFEAESVAGGVRLRVSLVPRIVLARIEAEGNVVFSDDRIRELVGLDVGDELTNAGLITRQADLQAQLVERGFVDAHVEFVLRDTDQLSRKVLRILVQEGEARLVTRIAFVGPDGTELALPDEAIFPGEIGLSVDDVLDVTRLNTGVREAEARGRDEGFLELRLDPPEVDRATGVVRIPAIFGHRYRVSIRGEAPLSRTDVEGVLELRAERLTDAVVENIRIRVHQLYERHGFREARVLVRRTLDPAEELQDGSLDPSRGLLEIAVTPGIPLRVVGISFPGAVHFEPNFLRDQVLSYLEQDLPSSQPFEPVDSDVIDRIGLSGRIPTARRSVPAPLVSLPASVWFEPTYREAVTHIAELYQAAGYLDVRVEEASLSLLEDHRAVVTVSIFEGPRTLVYDIRIRGNESVSTRECLEAARLMRGEAFSHIALEEARRRLISLYQDRGHLFVRVEPVVHRSADRGRAEIVIDIIERFPVHIGAIRIEGRDATDEALIRQALHFGEGDLYRPEVIRQSEETLLRLGIFSSVSITPADPELAERVKSLTVTVAERPAQELALSAGVGTGEGARGGFEYAYRNLFGYAVSLSLRVQLAFQFFFQDRELEEAITALNLQDRLERRITIGLAFPHIPGLRNVRAGLDLVHLRDNFRDFGLDKNGAVLTFTWQPERRFQGSLSTEIEQNGVTLFGNISDLQEYLSRPEVMMDPRTQRLLRVPQGVSAIGSIRALVSLDLRDSAFTPTDGFYASAALEWAHTIATERETDYSHFFKLTLTANGYVSLADDWVLALQVRGGRVFHLENISRTYPNRAYFLGGVDSLRGFLQDQVLPQDQVELIDSERTQGRTLNPAAIVRTGDFFYLGRAELRFPLFGSLQGGVFVDVGNVWAFGDAVRFEALFRLRVSAGAGVRITTPVGPIALDYGFNLTRREDLAEPFGAFHFSIGLF